MTVVDAHAHLWARQNGRVDGRPVIPLENGKSDFGGETRQMMPPYMTNGANTAERLIANMDYARVSAAVITQEEIDGNQDDYLLCAKQKYPERLKICSLYEEGKPFRLEGFDGVKLCAGRLKTQDLTKHAAVFEAAECAGKFISIDLATATAKRARSKSSPRSTRCCVLPSDISAWSRATAGTSRSSSRGSAIFISKAAASPGFSTVSFTLIHRRCAPFARRQSFAAWKS